MTGVGEAGYDNCSRHCHCGAVGRDRLGLLHHDLSKPAKTMKIASDERGHTLGRAAFIDLMENTVFAKLFECRNCGSFNGYASRPRNFAERYILPLLFLRTVRCGDCYSRSFRTRWAPVQEQRRSKSGRAAA
jgi:hypothetical protein